MIKFYIMLCIVTILSAQKVYSYSNTPLDSILIQISEDYKFDIIFNQDLVGNILISGRFKKVDLNTLLTDLLSNTFLTFKIKKSLIIIKKNSQNASIQGFIYDKETGKTLSSAYVYLKELNSGTVTNSEGYFNLTGIPIGQHHLVVSSYTYTTFVDNINLSSNGLFYTCNLLEGTQVGDLVNVVSENYLHQINMMKHTNLISINPKLLSKTPQLAEQDLFRTMQSLPGISSSSDMSSNLFIRGGSSDQNLFMVDGAVIYNPNHLMGFYTSINTDLVQNVDIYKSTFPAEYGGRLSSVIDITQKEGSKSKISGTSAISLISRKLSVEIPISSNLNMTTSYRKSSLNKRIREIYNVALYRFYDMQSTLTYQLDKRNKLMLSFLKTNDVFQSDPKTGSIEQLGNWQNQILSFKWSSVLSSKLFSKIWLTHSNYTMNYDTTDQLRFRTSFYQNVISDLMLKSRIQYKQNLKNESILGFELKYLENLYDLNIIDRWRIKFNYKNALLASAYYSHQYKFSTNLNLRAGMRYSYFKNQKKSHILSPRMSVNYKLNKQTHLQYSFNKTEQYFHQVPWDGPDDWLLLDENRTVSTAIQHNISFRTLFKNNYEMSLEFYTKQYADIYLSNFHVEAGLKTNILSETGLPVYTNSDGFFHPGSGSSYGAELLIKKNKGFISGWTSYSYSKDKVRFNGINQGNYYRPSQHRTHKLKLDFQLALKKQKSASDTEWNLGFNFFYNSGQPLTIPTSHYISSVTPSKVDGTELDLFSQATSLNNVNAPYYMRLDANLSVKFHTNYAKITSYISAFNIGKRKNYFYQKTGDKSLSWPDNNLLLKPVQNEHYQFPYLLSYGLIIDF